MHSRRSVHESDMPFCTGPALQTAPCAVLRRALCFVSYSDEVLWQSLIILGHRVVPFPSALSPPFFLNWELNSGPWQMLALPSYLPSLVSSFELAWCLGLWRGRRSLCSRGCGRGPFMEHPLRVHAPGSGSPSTSPACDAFSLTLSNFLYMFGFSA